MKLYKRTRLRHQNLLHSGLGLALARFQIRFSAECTALPLYQRAPLACLVLVDAIDQFNLLSLSVQQNQGRI